MKIKKLILTSLFLGLLLIVGCKTEKKTDANSEMTEDKTEEIAENLDEVEDNSSTDEQSENIVEVAAGNGDFSTLVAAVKAAGLVETLSGAGPFTVFAPTNTAFGNLPDGTVEGLLKPESKDALTTILTYHVVSGKFNAADVVKAINDGGGSFTIATAQGGNLTASLDGDSVVLTDVKGNKSKVVIADVAASNGVIHAIDAVVMPN